MLLVGLFNDVYFSDDPNYRYVCENRIGLDVPASPCAVFSSPVQVQRASACCATDANAGSACNNQTQSLSSDSRLCSMKKSERAGTSLEDSITPATTGSVSSESIDFA